MNFAEKRLAAIDVRIDILGELVHALANSLEQPVYGNDGCFRYKNPTDIHYCLLKSSRIVSALYACSALCRGGRGNGNVHSNSRELFRRNSTIVSSIPATGD